MNRIQNIIIVVFALQVFQLPLTAQVEFIEVTNLEEMEQARFKASESDKPLFVDVYATWCGPCKMMDREVYPDPAVSAYMNSNFVNVRMDGETVYGSRFASENGLQGYPSVFLFDPGGGHMSTLVGFMNAEDLLVKLRESVNNYKAIGQMKQSYETGSLDNNDYPIYLASLRAMGQEEEAEKIALKYMISLEENKKLTDNDIRVIAFYLTMDHALWPSVSKDTEEMKEFFGEDYLIVIENVFNRTLMKGIEEENLEIIDLLSENIGKYLEGSEIDSESLIDLPYLQYYYFSDKHNELIRYIDNTYSEKHEGDHEWLYGVTSRVIDMDQQYITPEIQQKGLEWFQTCIELEAQFDYYFYKGMCHFFTQNIFEAKESFTAAGKLAEDADQKQLIEQVMQFINTAE